MHLRKNHQMYSRLKSTIKIVTYLLLRPFLSFILPNQVPLYGHLILKKDEHFPDYRPPTFNEFTAFVKFARNNNYQFLNLKNYTDRDRVSKKILLTMDDGYQSLINEFIPFLIHENIPCIFSILGGAQSPDFKIQSIKSSQCFFKINEILFLKKSGFEVAYHSYSHARIYNHDYEFILNEQLFEREIIPPIQIAEALSKKPLIFTYPYKAPSSNSLDEKIFKNGFDYILKTSDYFKEENRSIVRIPMDIDKSFYKIKLINPIFYNLLFASLKTYRFKIRSS